MLALSDARWSSFTHAYGPAVDVPALLVRARDDTGLAALSGDIAGARAILDAELDQDEP
jgi:hypothetical protein